MEGGSIVVAAINSSSLAGMNVGMRAWHETDSDQEREWFRLEIM